MLLADYSHESCLPCQLNEIVVRVKKRSLEFHLADNVGLSKDITIVSLYRGFLLFCKDLVVQSDSIDLLYRLDGTCNVAELTTQAGNQSALEQLNYYGLLSFGTNNGRLNLITVKPQHAAKYTESDFSIFSFVPLTVELCVTNTCNLECMHCIKNSGPKGNDGSELTNDELKAIIQDCGQSGIINLLFMGGEPLTYPHFFDLLEHAKRNGILHLRTSSNGWLINRETANELSKYFDNIQISVHGATGDTHDRIVGKKGAWEQARKATEYLRENNVRVNISFTVMKENATDIREMYDMVQEWGGNSLRFLRLINEGRGCNLNKWSDKEVIEIGAEIRQMREKGESNVELDAGGFPALSRIKNDATGAKVQKHIGL